MHSDTYDVIVSIHDERFHHYTSLLFEVSKKHEHIKGTMKGRKGGTPLGVGNANNTQGLSFLPEVGYTLPL